jgi:hypothetical protein
VPLARPRRARLVPARRRLPAALPRALLVALLLILLGPAAAQADIVSRGPAATVTYASDSTTRLQLPVPAGAQPGDVLIASLGFGRSSGSTQPALVTPPGWTLVSRTDLSSSHALAIFSHVLTSGETGAAWTTDVPVGGTAFVAAFGGVDTGDPIDTWAGRTVTKKSKSIATPSVTTSVSSTMLVASYSGYRGDGKGATWTAPAGMSELADAANSSGSRSGSLDAALQSAAGNSGAKTATTSVDQDKAIAVLTALRPVPVVMTVPPTISAVGAGALTTTGATVTWATDQPSDTQVDYGPTASYGSSTPLSGTLVTSHAQPINGLTPNTVYHYRVRSRNSTGLTAVSGDFTFKTTTSGAVPLIVDTDIWSDADDVGALATAFGLQLRGETNVIAIGVNTRTSRPAVATNSWKCVAAVTNFYRSSGVPIGTSMPANGTATNTPDFVGPCSRLAPSSTPVPESVVTVFRRALVGQPDGSVVIAEAGYNGNLAALLASPADSISPLTGRELIARKVNTLVVMGGGYPSRSGENNLIGDPASAQAVASGWPTKVVWSGYEVGDQIHTGDTISSVHPSSSPVRVSYEAFVGAGHWIYSYDLTAIYHAIRPRDSVLTEVGPGTNVVDSSGGNRFTSGSGNQYYLRLGSATTLDASIEALLDTLPSSPPSDTTAPSISGVGTGAVGPAGATVSWSTNEQSSSQVEYGPTTGYGYATTLDTALSLSHSQTLAGLSASTTYHYRVKSRDGAGNLAVSGDFTFTTAAGGGTGPGLALGPSDTFDAAPLDPGSWVVSSAGSSVGVVSGELAITHPAGLWTKGSVTSAVAHNQAGHALQVQMKRAANAGQGGSTYGETSIYLTRDGTHWASFFVAGGSLTAWANSGSGDVNLTPSWPAYNSTSMQWLRFRESGGRLYWETAGGTTSPGPWTALASLPDPFAMDAVKFQIVAGSNVNTTDAARFDNVSTG